MSLDAEAIGKANDTNIEEVEVPEWGGSVHIRSASSAAVTRWQAAFDEDGKSSTDNVFAKFVAMCLCDKDGVLLYPDHAAGTEAIGNRNAKVVLRLFNIARRLNGISDEDMKELEKN